MGVATVENLVRQKKFAQAAAKALPLLKKKKKDAVLWWAVALSHIEKGSFKEGLDALSKLFHLKSGYSNSAIELAARISFEHEFWDEGLPAWKLMAKLQPSNYLNHYGLGMCYYRSDKYATAAKHLQAAYDLNASDLHVSTFLASSLFQSGSVIEALDITAKALVHFPSHQELVRFSASYQNYVANEDVGALQVGHERFGEYIGPTTSVFESAPSKAPKNIAFYSSSIRHHSVAYFLIPLLEGLKCSEREWNVICIKENSQSDSVSQTISALCNKVIESHSLSDAQLLSELVDQKIDIFIDLEGLVSPVREILFKNKVAPIYATYLGYPNVTAIKSMDYRFTDNVVDPPGSEIAGFGEELSSIKGAFLCYRPLGLVPDVRNRTSDSGVVFASFNAAEKITPEVRIAWAEILERTPGSTLIVKNRVTADKHYREAFCREFEQRGVDVARVRFEDYSESYFAHLKIYNDIDICLDPFPYSGTTTSFEALWQGVPIVALEGTVHRSRVTASINTRIGLSDFNASSIDSYVNKAVGFADRIEEVRELRMGMRERLKNSPFMDEKSFTKSFEDLLLSL